MVTLFIALNSYEVYIDIVTLSAHELIDICGISVEFEGHICYWHIYGYNMENKSYSLGFFDLYVQ